MTHSGFFVRLVSSIVSVQVGISPPSTPLLVTARHHHSVALWFLFCCDCSLFFCWFNLEGGWGESLGFCFNSEILSTDPKERGSHSLARHAGHRPLLHCLQRRWVWTSRSPPPRPPKHSAVSPSFPLSLFVAAKEEEKQKLMKWSSELKLEREQLELRVKQLSNSITVRWPGTFLLNWLRVFCFFLIPFQGPKTPLPCG